MYCGVYGRVDIEWNLVGFVKYGCGYVCLDYFLFWLWLVSWVNFELGFGLSCWGICGNFVWWLCWYFGWCWLWNDEWIVCLFFCCWMVWFFLVELVFWRNSWSDDDDWGCVICWEFDGVECVGWVSIVVGVIWDDLLFLYCW